METKKKKKTEEDEEEEEEMIELEIYQMMWWNQFFSRISLKSLIRLKVVSKTWHNSINNIRHRYSPTTSTGMEGLIPLVCKTIKRNKTLRKYESLSSAANNICEDFYPDYGGVEKYQSLQRTLFLLPKDKQLVRFTVTESSHVTGT
ncbi:hypothetical protein HAX54_003203 [Datura stramonium]|uniref:F-box domain-containing protein n=1 Tax=Datura stramonium TaxID=4076 RepID=A0ABS8T507_DATST|nr:hypothetical protein [Datura stramonium]